MDYTIQAAFYANRKRLLCSYAGISRERLPKEWILRDANALHRLAGHPNIVHTHPPFPWEDNKIVLPVEWVDGYSFGGMVKPFKIAEVKLE